MNLIILNGAKLALTTIKNIPPREAKDTAKAIQRIKRGQK